MRCADARRGAGDDRGDRPRQEGRRHASAASFEVVARGVPPGLGVVRAVGPPARRPHRPGADVDPRREGGGDRRRLRGRRDAAARRSTTRSSTTTRARPRTGPRNRAGGLEGGVTNGEELRAQAVVKPIPTLLIAAALGRPAHQGAAEGLGRAQRHLRRARRRAWWARRWWRCVLGRRAAREVRRRLARRAARPPRGHARAARELAGRADARSTPEIIGARCPSDRS